MIRSPLTGTDDIERLGAIDAETVVSLYRAEFGVDVAAAFASAREVGLYRCRTSGLFFFSPAIAGDAGFYADLQKHDWYYEPRKPEYDLAARYVPADAEVLEIGCGAAAFAAYIPGRRYLGLEFNEAAIARARAAGFQAERRSVQDHAASGARADVVCSFQVLEHVTDPLGFVEAAKACVRPGGRLILAVPHGGSYLTSPGPHLLLNGPPHHLSWWPPETFFWLQEKLGMRLVALDAEPLHARHYGYYLQLLAWRVVRGFRRKQPAPLEIPSTGDWDWRLAGRIARRLSWKLTDPRLAAPGHTLLAVFEDKA